MLPEIWLFSLKLNLKSNKVNLLIDFLRVDKDEHIENCFRLEKFFN